MLVIFCNKRNQNIVVIVVIGNRIIKSDIRGNLGEILVKYLCHGFGVVYDIIIFAKNYVFFNVKVEVGVPAQRLSNVQPWCLQPLTWIRHWNGRVDGDLWWFKFMWRSWTVYIGPGWNIDITVVSCGGHVVEASIYVYTYERNRYKITQLCIIMMTSSTGNIFRVTGPLCGEFTGHR